MFSDILQPAIDLATNGFPVSAVAAYHWHEGQDGLLADGNPHGRTFLLGNRAPHAGEVMRLPMLAETMKVWKVSSDVCDVAMCVVYLFICCRLWWLMAKMASTKAE